jgi:hypothetical protein
MWFPCCLVPSLSSRLQDFLIVIIPPCLTRLFVGFKGRLLHIHTGHVGHIVHGGSPTTTKVCNIADQRPHHVLVTNLNINIGVKFLVHLLKLAVVVKKSIAALEAWSGRVRRRGLGRV